MGERRPWCRTAGPGQRCCRIGRRCPQTTRKASRRVRPRLYPCHGASTRPDRAASGGPCVPPPPQPPLPPAHTSTRTLPRALPHSVRRGCSSESVPGISDLGVDGAWQSGVRPEVLTDGRPETRGSEPAPGTAHRPGFPSQNPPLGPPRALALGCILDHPQPPFKFLLTARDCTPSSGRIQISHDGPRAGDGAQWPARACAGELATRAGAYAKRAGRPVCGLRETVRGTGMGNGGGRGVRARWLSARPATRNASGGASASVRVRVRVRARVPPSPRRHRATRLR